MAFSSAPGSCVVCSPLFGSVPVEASMPRKAAPGVVGMVSASGKGRSGRLNQRRRSFSVAVVPIVPETVAMPSMSGRSCLSRSNSENTSRAT